MFQLQKNPLERKLCHADYYIAGVAGPGGATGGGGVEVPPFSGSWLPSSRACLSWPLPSSSSYDSARRGRLAPEARVALLLPGEIMVTTTWLRRRQRWRTPALASGLTSTRKTLMLSLPTKVCNFEISLKQHFDRGPQKRFGLVSGSKMVASRTKG